MLLAQTFSPPSGTDSLLTQTQKHTHTHTHTHTVETVGDAAHARQPAGRDLKLADAETPLRHATLKVCDGHATRARVLRGLVLVRSLGIEVLMVVVVVVVTRSTIRTTAVLGTAGGLAQVAERRALCAQPLRRRRRRAFAVMLRQWRRRRSCKTSPRENRRKVTAPK